MINRLLLVLCAIIATTLAPAGLSPGEASARLSSPRDGAAVRRADSATRALHAAVGAPAMTVAVRRGDRLIWSAAYGSPSLESGGRLSPQSLFRAGSVSKLFTAMALMRLRQQGRLDLDAPVQRFLPAFAHHPSVTLRQIAGHLGGIRHYREGDRALTSRHFNSVEETANIVATDPLLHAPGSRYVYSSFGYNLLAASIERVGGSPFLDQVRSLVFDPLGMTRSGPDQVAAIVPGRVAAYQRDSGSVRNAAFVDPSYKWAGGGFLSNVEELTLLGAALLRTDFLSAAHRDEMLTSLRTAAGAETGVGIGWRIGRDWAGRRIYHHAGSQEGSRAVLLVYPDEGLSIAIMTNLAGEPALIEPSAAAILEPFITRETARTRLPQGDYAVSGRGVRGDFSGQVSIDRSGNVALSGIAPLIGFGTAIGVSMPEALRAPMVAARDGATVAFILTPYGYVPIRLSWLNGTLRGQSLLPGSPVDFSFASATAAGR